jgi:hypothetical protein
MTQHPHQTLALMILAVQLLMGRYATQQTIRPNDPIIILPELNKLHNYIPQDINQQTPHVLFST